MPHGRVRGGVRGPRADPRTGHAKRHGWPGLAAVGEVTARREESGGRATVRTRFHRLGRAFAPERFGARVHAHRAIENGPHRGLDVALREDRARNRRGHGPRNPGPLRRLALDLATLDPSKRSKLKRAGWDNRFLARMLARFASPQTRSPRGSPRAPGLSHRRQKVYPYLIRWPTNVWRTMQPLSVTRAGLAGAPGGLIVGRGGADGPPAPPRASADRPDEDRDLAAVRVLVVEDEALVALNLTTMLEDLGAEVCGTVASGQEAVRRARLLRPQLAVVDIRLKDGETSGIDAARVMADEAGVAIVFATAHSDPGTVALMATVPGAEQLFKPYDVRQLAGAMRRALRRRRRTNEKG